MSAQVRSYSRPGLLIFINYSILLACLFGCDIPVPTRAIGGATTRSMSRGFPGAPSVPLPMCVIGHADNVASTAAEWSLTFRRDWQRKRRKRKRERARHSVALSNCEYARTHEFFLFAHFVLIRSLHSHGKSAPFKIHSAAVPF